MLTGNEKETSVKRAITPDERADEERRQEQIH